MKKIIKNFNNLVKKTIFKVQNKTNDKFNISNFNKYLVTLIVSLFIYLFYLLTPLLYDKVWVQAKIESKLLNEFKINLNNNTNISYRILPAPHFLIKDSKMLMFKGEKTKSKAEIKDFKVFLSQSNFFDKEKMNIKKVVISDANFSLLRNDHKLFHELMSKNFSNKKIKINNSNVFFKDNLEETISIIKIDKIILFFNDQKLVNIIDVEGEVFNVPFTFNFINSNNFPKYKKINFNSKSLDLNIYNEFITEKGLTSGKNNISFLKSKINTKYDIKEKLIIFESDNPQINYDGELSINPFNLNFNVQLDNQNISKLFNINPILIEFIKSGLLFNDNISVNSSVIISANEKKEIFHKAKINFNIINGKMNLDNTKFFNNEIGFLKLSNSNLFLENNNLIFTTDIFFDVKNSDNLFSYFKINKEFTKNFKKILINLKYDLSNNEIKFNNIKIDNKNMSDQFLDVIKNLNHNNLNNLVKGKRLINKLMSIYEG